MRESKSREPPAQRRRQFLTFETCHLPAAGRSNASIVGFDGQAASDGFDDRQDGLREAIRLLKRDKAPFGRCLSSVRWITGVGASVSDTLDGLLRFSTQLPESRQSVLGPKRDVRVVAWRCP